MGRSSCFRIVITCAGDSSADDRDDHRPRQKKRPNDKRGWSFRKRSTHHRVLSNTVITEPPYSAHRESSESANVDFQSPDTTIVPEKISVIQCTDEKLQLPLAGPEVSETIVVTQDESEAHAQLEESVVIVIQTAVRGFMAQKELYKLKMLVKLQAAVRGHLVRQHAVGTLRCVQAIVKMQALVRARSARLLQDRSATEKKIDRKHENAILKTSGEESSTTKPNVTYTSIKKLLSNRFARQLLESTPKERPIHIKCDPLKPNSAWNWLERWMSFSSAEPTPQPESTNEQLERERKIHLASLLETVVPSEDSCELGDSESNLKEAVLPSETKEKLIIYNADNFKFQEGHTSASLVGNDLEQPLSGNISKSCMEEPSVDKDYLPSVDKDYLPSQIMQFGANSLMQLREDSEDTNSLPSQTIQSDVDSQMNINVLSHKAENEGEPTHQPKRSMKRYASEELETEGKKFVYGSRKGSNPSFVAAHSKFEELTSSSKSLSSSYQDGGFELNEDTVSSGDNTVTRTKELNMVEDAVPNQLRAPYGGSECGTELSVTSTLDSPDVYEIGAEKDEHEAKSLEIENCNPENIEHVDDKSKSESTDPVSPIMIQPEILDSTRGESVDSVIVADSPNIEKTPDRSASDVQVGLYSGTGDPAYRSSPEVSPRSHVTVPESQGTPSSQISVKTNYKKTDRSASSHKRKSFSAGKRSPLNSNADSGAKSSMEQLPRDPNNGKRRNSFGSTRLEETDSSPRQEPRNNSSSSSVPHFMQATQSARAKIQANSSPRSSPDAQDREYIKKRQSLPGTNGRQGSPRILRSISQAQPAVKGNSNPIVHERKWQR
ncbi:protein IQ-DOMAIN 32 [Mercurialis annua]|uniref:protein IQ-DOMAIN 32 n=1 Tax=Mercurialis annua TaxID=3986 RepID=UPI002160704C|nr:protein IQ-DOMAIN 32 [Mercurialis annua]